MSTLSGAGSGASCSFTAQYLNSQIFRCIQEDGRGENPFRRPGKPDLRGQGLWRSWLRRDAGRAGSRGADC